MRFSRASHAESGSPPACSASLQAWSSQAVPPPEPNLWPTGSEVQNHSALSAFSTSWKHSTRFGGSDNNFYQLKLDYRQYRPMGERRVLTWTVQSNNVFGTVPLLKYALTGTPFDLRGYYMGQFRDKSAHLALAEWRQMINTDRTTWVKRMLHHVGYAVWGGAGFMGPRPTRVEGVLPNLGVGLRIEIQPRMNLRLDFGRDMVNRQNLFYLNMTEAF